VRADDRLRRYVRAPSRAESRAKKLAPAGYGAGSSPRSAVVGHKERRRLNSIPDSGLDSPRCRARRAAEPRGFRRARGSVSGRSTGPDRAVGILLFDVERAPHRVRRAWIVGSRAAARRRVLVEPLRVSEITPHSTRRPARLLRRFSRSFATSRGSNIGSLGQASCRSWRIFVGAIRRSPPHRLRRRAPDSGAASCTLLPAEAMERSMRP